MTQNRPPKAHIYLLLDRSGSMESVRDDVVGGFNRFLADQQADGADARFTFVQFDSQDPEEVLVDGAPIARVRPLTAAAFQPRGGTPLLDATGRIIARATAREERRRAAGRRAEDITVVTITDGQENQSHECTREHVRELVAARQARGWSFAFLGAGLDAYAEAGGMGYDPRSVSVYAPDAAGNAMAFASASRAMRSKRSKLRAGAPVLAADFFEGVKEAEDDRARRHR